MTSVWRALVQVILESKSVWPALVLGNLWHKVSLTSFSFSSFWNRRHFNDNGHILIKDDWVKSHENSFLQLSKYMEFLMGRYSSDSCTLPIVKTVHGRQSRFIIGGVTVDCHLCDVGVFYSIWPMHLQHSLPRSRAAFHHIFYGSSCMLDWGLYAHVLRGSSVYRRQPRNSWPRLRHTWATAWNIILWTHVFSRRFIHDHIGQVYICHLLLSSDWRLHSSCP